MDLHDPTSNFLTEADITLLDYQFRIDDPESVAGRVETVPDNWGEAKIEGYYELSTKRPPIRCAHPRRHRHWKGAVLRTPDGKAFLVGWKCGLDKHGINIHAKKEFDSLRSRQQYLRVLARVGKPLRDALADIRTTLAGRAPEDFEELRSGLKRLSEACFLTLRSAIQNNGGLLNKTERVRDHAAEQKQREQDQARIEDLLSRAKGVPPSRRPHYQAEVAAIQRSAQPIYKYVSVAIGVVAGGTFICPPASPGKQLEEAQTKLRLVFKRMTETGEVSTLDLAKMSRVLRQGIDDAKAAVHTLNEVPLFFGEENLRRVAAAGGLQARGKSLSDGKRTIQPSNYIAPSAPNLTRLENAFVGDQPAQRRASAA